MLNIGSLGSRLKSFLQALWSMHPEWNGGAERAHPRGDVWIDTWAMGGETSETPESAIRAEEEIARAAAEKREVPRGR